MPWWEASLWIGLLPLSILLFRWLLVGYGAHFFHNSIFMRIGLVVCVAILGSGFIGTGHAMIGLLNYTRLEEEGVRIVKFLEPEKFQRWADLQSVDEMKWAAWEWGKRDTPYKKTTTFKMHFKENGKWSVYLYISSDDFSASDFEIIHSWIHANFTFETQPS